MKIFGQFRLIIDFIFSFLEICQIRLDFVMGNFAQPVAGTGQCTGQDTLTITAGGAESIPVLCGDITGQHCKRETNSNQIKFQ